MRKPNSDKKHIACDYFVWLVGKRDGIFYADGRGNRPVLGRYSLGTSDRAEASEALKQLDKHQAVKAGKARKDILNETGTPLSLVEGRRLYEAYVKRPVVTGGTRPKTQSRYRAVLDKFLKFAPSIHVTAWSQVTSHVLEQYAAYLEQKGYEYNTQYLELTTLKQIVRWLITEKHLPESNRILMKLSRDDETTTYCWTVAEFQAMVEYCQQKPGLNWLANVFLALGLTGMRISELAQLRWSNIDLTENPQIALIDESRRSRRGRSRTTTKNKRSRRFPINLRLVPVLKSLPRHADGLVFHGPRNGKIKPDTIRNILIKEVLAPLKKQFPAADGDVGFEHGRLHSFRHFFCSQCANQGVTERALMNWLGHRNAAMVRRYYHLDAEESRRQMDRVSIPVVTVGMKAGGVVHCQEANPPSPDGIS